VLTQVIETLSKGFKRRVGLAQALLHNPPVLILDEPTDGLDPNQKHEVRELINAMAADKITIISTHILEEVEAVCNRAIIIAAGRLLVDDTPQGLEARSRYHNAVTLKLAAPTALATAKERISELPGVASIEVIEKDQSITAFPKYGELILPALSNLAAQEKWPVAALHLESGRLDEVFRAVTAAPSITPPASIADASQSTESEASHA
jgi:ABC-2 type transport system ATP-binding protein